MKKRLPDVLVLGVGRSGTTAVARVLHQHFGVCFGHHPSMYRTFRDQTIYEDKILKRKLELVREMGGAGWHGWLRAFHHVHYDCGAVLTGVKLLDLPYLPLEAFRYIKPRLIVRTYREIESCIDSWCRYNQKRNRQWHSARCRQREALIVKLEKKLPMVRMEFAPEKFRWSDGGIAHLLNKYLDA